MLPLQTRTIFCDGKTLLGVISNPSGDPRGLACQ
jgi:hypothetical protein